MQSACNVNVEDKTSRVSTQRFLLEGGLAAFELFILHDISVARDLCIGLDSTNTYFDKAEVRFFFHFIFYCLLLKIKFQKTGVYDMIFIVDVKQLFRYSSFLL